MLRSLAHAVLLSVIPSAAMAAPTYDLQSLVQSTQQKSPGAIIRTVESSEEVNKHTVFHAGVAVQGTNEVTRSRDEHVTTIHAVNSAGKATSMDIRYQAFSKSGPEGPLYSVAGVDVQIREESGSYRYEQKAGPAIPQALHDELADRVQKMNKNKDDSLQGMTFLFAERPVAIGESWDIDVYRLLSELEFDAFLAEDQQRGTGVIRSTSMLQGREFVVIALEWRLNLLEFSELSCISSCYWDWKMEVTLPADGQYGDTKFTMAMELDGRFTVPDPERSVELEFDSSNHTTNTKRRIQ